MANLSASAIKTNPFSEYAARHTIKKSDEKDYRLCYQNPYFGNELLVIEDDDSLRVALKALRVRGKSLMKVFVSHYAVGITAKG
jgi:hypothetical protein